ncbi:class I SAM-dependent methyltransferase [Actinosynnema sp. NPDC020468]|uniref:class I SAM-dependent methyltransferase n=1 Tax=Actinosynnema sp. NPDC020468 TaxID=3154488 RepID=UPI0033F4A442
MKHFDHNAHYHDLLLSHVPPTARTALDLGSGHGAFARRLVAHGLAVTAVDQAVDLDAPGVDFRRVDAMTGDLGGPYDYVSCVATLHHLPCEAALARMRDVLAPGGVLAVLGLAKEESPLDWAFSLTSVPLNLVRRLRHDDPPQGAPVAAWSMSLREIAESAERVIPGARIRRHLYWRYSLSWTRR